MVAHIGVPSPGPGFAPDSVLKGSDPFSEGVRPACGGEGGGQSARGGGEFLGVWLREEMGRVFLRCLSFPVRVTG